MSRQDYVRLHVKNPYPFQIAMKLELSLDRFSKNVECEISRKTRPVGAELFHRGGRTQMTKLIVAF